MSDVRLDGELGVLIPHCDGNVDLESEGPACPVCPVCPVCRLLVNLNGGLSTPESGVARSIMSGRGAEGGSGNSIPLVLDVSDLGTGLGALGRVDDVLAATGEDGQVAVVVDDEPRRERLGLRELERQAWPDGGMRAVHGAVLVGVVNEDAVALLAGGVDSGDLHRHGVNDLGRAGDGRRLGLHCVEVAHDDGAPLSRLLSNLLLSGGLVDQVTGSAVVDGRDARVGLGVGRLRDVLDVTRASRRVVVDNLVRVAVICN